MSMDIQEFKTQMDKLRSMRMKLLEKQMYDQEKPEAALPSDIAKAVELLVGVDQGPVQSRKDRLQMIYFILQKYERTLECLED